VPTSNSTGELGSASHIGGIGWVEWAVEPVRDRLTRSDYDDLVSSLALVIGWEAFHRAARRPRGASVGRARALRLRAAEAILDGALAKADRT
jgi:hypothetical protein